MGIYQVLNQPASAYKPSFFDANVQPILNTLAENKKKKALEDAIKQYGLTPEFSVDEAGNIATKYSRPKEEKQTDTVLFRKALQKDIGGESAWEDVQGQYPDKTEKIKKIKTHNTPVSMAEDFIAGTGSPVSRIKSLFKPNQAEIDSATQRVIDNIKTQADLNEFLKDIDDYESAGVDVKAIKEYFGLK